MRPEIAIFVMANTVFLVEVALFLLMKQKDGDSDDAGVRARIQYL